MKKSTSQFEGITFFFWSVLNLIVIFAIKNENQENGVCHIRYGNGGLSLQTSLQQVWQNYQMLPGGFYPTHYKRHKLKYQRSKPADNHKDFSRVIHSSRQSRIHPRHDKSLQSVKQNQNPDLCTLKYCLPEPATKSKRTSFHKINNFMLIPQRKELIEQEKRASLSMIVKQKRSRKLIVDCSSQRLGKKEGKVKKEWKADQQFVMGWDFVATEDDAYF